LEINVYFMHKKTHSNGLRVRLVCSSSGGDKPKTMELVFADSPISTQK
jgi:hypothetical protein